MKLLAVYLGGYAPHCNVEIHDMVFVVGENIEACYPALIQKWFLKSYKQFHYDGYQDLSIVDGHKANLSNDPSNSDLKLFYVHLGGYDSKELNELHKNCFLVATDKTEAKDRARKSWDQAQNPHKDVQCEVESCLEIDQVDQHYIHLEPTNEQPNTNLHLGYNLIPPKIIEATLSR